MRFLVWFVLVRTHRLTFFYTLPPSFKVCIVGNQYSVSVNCVTFRLSTKQFTQSIGYIVMLNRSVIVHCGLLVRNA